LLNFDKTQGQLPNQKKYTKTQSEIIKGFVKNLPNEILVLFKQRYTEAKAFGEKDPKSYLVLEPGRYVNYMECFPRNSENLNYSCEEEKFFAEDSYELDPRIDNRDVKLVFYPFELDDKSQLHITVIDSWIKFVTIFRKKFFLFTRIVEILTIPRKTLHIVNISPWFKDKIRLWVFLSEGLCFCVSLLKQNQDFIRKVFDKTLNDFRLSLSIFFLIR
jgi:hypothetical protein